MPSSLGSNVLARQRVVEELWRYVSLQTSLMGALRDQVTIAAAVGVLPQRLPAS